MNFVSSMIVPCNCRMLFDLSLQICRCTPIVCTDNISSLFLCPQLLDKLSVFHPVFIHLSLQLQERVAVCNWHPLLSWPCEYVCRHVSIRGVTLSSPRETRYRQLRLFLFYYQLVYFNIHNTNAFTQATSIILRNSFKGQRLIDIV